MDTYSRTWEKVDLDAIRNNIEAFRKNIRKEAMLCAVIKTDGYGLGAVPIAKTIDDIVWGYCVATIDEALNLRANGIIKPVLILGYVPESCFEELIDNDIRYAGFQTEKLKVLSELAQRKGKKAYVHVKVDTGMGRIGIMPEAVRDFMKTVSKMEGLIIEGMFTHMATADMTDNQPAKKQEKTFCKLIEQLKSENMCPLICHCGNSAASIWMNYSSGDMFRVGISLYGYYPSEEVTKDIVRLTPAMELKSTIAYIKTVEPGTPIGYGGTYVTDKKTRVATVTIGYGDGYPRTLSNKGYMLVRGKKAPIIGRVCMDQTMLDVTEIPEAEADDIVTVIGKEGTQEITVEEISGLAGTFNYEFLCDIGKRVPRVYYRNGKIVGVKKYSNDLYKDFTQ